MKRFRWLFLVCLCALPACLRPEVRRGVVLPLPSMCVDEPRDDEEADQAAKGAESRTNTTVVDKVPDMVPDMVPEPAETSDSLARISSDPDFAQEESSAQGTETNASTADASTVEHPMVLPSELPTKPSEEMLPTSKGVPIDLLPETPATPPDKDPPQAEASEIMPVHSTETQTDANEAPLLQALRCYLENRPGDAMPILGQFDRDNQEMLLCLLPLTARLTDSDGLPSGSEESGVLLDQLRCLEVPLRLRSALAVNTMRFCSKVEAFGVYDPLPPDHDFRPGELVRVYVEVDNFSSTREIRSDGREVHATHLAGSAEIRDFEKQLVWREDFRRDQPDRSLTRRHDYFDQYWFRLPTNLPPGHYTLWVQVQDQGTQPPRIARKSLDFRVVNTVARGGAD